MERDQKMIDRRELFARAGGALAAAGLMPAWATAATSPTRNSGTLTGSDIALTVGHAMWSVDGRSGHACSINGTVPGPLLRLREGTTARIAVSNTLAEDTSIHWHGLLVPSQYDGVPGLSFPGITPGETFIYELPLIQSGTYWYHSHSGMQEPMGQYGPLIVDPAGADPIQSDREIVIVLSDWSFMHPHIVMQKLKQRGGYFNTQKQTLAGMLAGRDQRLKDRLDWGRMRIDPTDVSDVTGSTYHYLVNGHGPADNWTALFEPGERIRLRFVNASAMTIFNVRIPGVKLTVVAADGQNVRSVDVDEFQISVAETYDVIITPREDRALTLVAESVDRSGLARATLTPRLGLTAPVPALRSRPLATMKDMGMNMGGVSMTQMAEMGGMSMAMRDQRNAPKMPLTPGVQTISPMPADRLSEPGQGLETAGHKVLVYADLVALGANPDTRVPSRQLEIHLTGNMERYMWAFDGKAYSEVTKPIAFRKDERVRVTLINDTMMAHPIHLHGHFFELVTGHGDHAPRKHTVNVLPGGTATFDVTTDAVGDWGFHCHMMYHMHAGMFQVVTVRAA